MRDVGPISTDSSRVFSYSFSFLILHYIINISVLWALWLFRCMCGHPHLCRALYFCNSLLQQGQVEVSEHLTIAERSLHGVVVPLNH